MKTSIFERLKHILVRWRMRADWDRRARKNALYYVATGDREWSEDAFFASGDSSVGHYILNDMINITQGQDPRSMQVVEIGCGVGRMTRALARTFGQVHGVDVSGEMIRKARAFLRECPNAHVHKTDGSTLGIFPDEFFDFAFSMLVFQHIPEKSTVESYIREVARVLKAGRLFKFQVQGATFDHPGRWNPVSLKRKPAAADCESELSTWLGTSFSEEEMRELAERNGFEMRYAHGAESQHFWLWFFKRTNR